MSTDCTSCGTAYDAGREPTVPGTDTQRCPQCGTRNQIESDEQTSDEATTTRGEYPINFDSWPREAQAQYVSDDHYRVSLMARCLRLAGYPVDEDALKANTPMTTEMLAAIYLELKGLDSGD